MSCQQLASSPNRDLKSSLERYFNYDSLSRLTFERQVEQDAPYYQPDATGDNYWSRKIIYNSDSLVTDSWDARGVQTHVTYDGLNRVSQITYTGEAATTTTPTVTYTYDEQRAGYFNRGRLTTVTTAAGGGTLTPVPQTAQDLDYDRMGRVQSQRQTVGATTNTLGYSYNLLGQLQSETYPSGRVVSTNYDAAARLFGVLDGGQSYANAFAYAGHGGLASETWGNGAVHTMSCNNRLQVSQIKLTVGGAEKQRFDYQYGEVNVDTAALDKTKNTSQVAIVDAWIDGVKQWQQRFAYDKLGRLSTGKELTDNQTQTGNQAWRVDYTFDRWGNRYQAAGQGGVPVADTDIDKTRNRFVTVGSTLMIYDAAGNLTIDQKFRGMQLTYDANGRMRRTDAANGYTTSVYDGAGQRVQTFDSITNITRQSFYDVYGRVMADYENGAWKRDYIYRSGLLLATVDASGTRYLLMDHQGSTRAVMNSTQIVERHDYKPFGEELGAGTGLRTTGQGYNAQNPIRQQYASTERDSPTGLDNAWFRKFDSSAGRWTSPDPYLGSMSTTDPQSLSRYSYVENDSVNYIDPSGLMLRCFTVVVGYITVHFDTRRQRTYAVSRVFCSYDPGDKTKGPQEDFDPKIIMERLFGPIFSKIRRYQECMEKERARIREELREELEEIHKRNMRDHAIAMAALLANGLALILTQTYVSSRNSDRIEDFNKTRLQPKLREAEEKCKKEAG